MSHHSSRAQSTVSGGSRASHQVVPGVGGRSHSVVLSYGPFDAIAAPSANLFTGPDNLKHHHINPVLDQQYVGNGRRSQEQTSQISYMTRPAPGSKFPLAKNGRIGEIGWPVEYFKVVKGV